MFDVVIVGAGHSGAHAAMALRQGGFGGSVLLIGDEFDPPYERPPLSKDYLAGDRETARLAFRPRAFWDERAITLRLGEAVTCVDAQAHTVEAGGEATGYGRLIWAAGGYARPLPLPGADLLGVHTVRTRAGVDALRRDLADARDVVVIGGGYIGLESAAVLTKAGKRVTVIEAQDRVLQRVTCGQLSRFYESEHRAHGVNVRTSTGVYAIEGEGRVRSVITTDGHVAADVVIVGIGLVPHAAVLANAGATVANGIEVDEHCRTSLADIYAVGDCAAHFNAFAHGQRTRLESVQNAVDMAKTAAAHILGREEPYRAVPWFWSNQYDLKLQTVGLCGGHDAVVMRGDPGTRSFSLVYLREDRVIAVDAVNCARDFTGGRALVERGTIVRREDLADSGRSLKNFAIG